MATSDERRPGRISVRGARRTLRAVERVENSSIGGVGASQAGNPWTYGTSRAKVTTAIPTGTFDSPSSSGRAQIYRKDSTGAWVAFGDPVVVWNQNVLTASLPVNRAIFLDWIGGTWWVTSGSCS